MAQKSLIQEAPITRMPFGSSDRHPGILPPRAAFDDLYQRGESLPSPQQIALIEARVRAEMEAKYAPILAENELLKSQVITDVLTGLSNERQMYTILKNEIKKSDRYGHPLSFMMIDVNFFKSVNDTYGHLGGDIVLKGIADIMQKYSRTDVDTSCRPHGDEFAMILPETPIDGAYKKALRMSEEVADTKFEYEGRIIRSSISIGLTPVQNEGVESVIKRADDALYQVKRNGRQGVFVMPLPGQPDFIPSRNIADLLIQDMSYVSSR